MRPAAREDRVAARFGVHFGGKVDVRRDGGLRGRPCGRMRGGVRTHGLGKSPPSRTDSTIHRRALRFPKPVANCPSGGGLHAGCDQFRFGVRRNFMSKLPDAAALPPLRWNSSGLLGRFALAIMVPAIVGGLVASFVPWSDWRWPAFAIASQIASITAWIWLWMS